LKTSRNTAFETHFSAIRIFLPNAEPTGETAQAQKISH
jgi:hypothetical protein